MNPPIDFSAVRDLLIAGAILGIVGSIYGCAAQPPPPPIVVQAPTPAPRIPDDPYASLPTDVAQAIKHNEQPPPSFQHGVTRIEPYSPDAQYSLLCEPLHVTEIRLRDDETTDKDNVKVGDVTRWSTIVGTHAVLVFPLASPTSITVAGAQVTIPAEPKLISNLVIHTNLGNDYIFDMKAVKIGRPFDQKIQFYFPDLVRAQYAARQAALKQAGQIQ